MVVLFVVFAVLLALKIMAVVQLSWWVVLAPLLICPIILIFTMLVIGSTVRAIIGRHLGW